MVIHTQATNLTKNIYKPSNMASRYTKKIPEYVYFVGEGEWIQGPFVNPQRGRVNRKFKITEVIEEDKEQKKVTRAVKILNKTL